MANRNIKVLSDRDHIYQKTEMYAGGVSEVQSSEYICTKDGIKRETVLRSSTRSSTTLSMYTSKHQRQQSL